MGGWWAKAVWVKGAGRPRPLRSRNDIKVFQEPHAGNAPYPTASQSSHVLPSHSIPPTRVSVYFSTGGFQGCGVPINNSPPSLSLSLSLYLFLFLTYTLSLSHSLSIFLPHGPLTLYPSFLPSVHIQQKCVPPYFPPTSGERSQNGVAPLHFTTAKVKCVVCACAYVYVWMRVDVCVYVWECECVYMRVYIKHTVYGKKFQISFLS